METPPVKTSKRQMALTIISAICGLGALMGTLPVDSDSLPMPPEWRPYIISIGFTGLTIEKWGKFVIAFINNYKIDKALFLLLPLLCLLLNSCADMKFGGLSLTTPYGTITSDKEGRISGSIILVEPTK